MTEDSRQVICDFEMSEKYHVRPKRIAAYIKSDYFIALQFQQSVRIYNHLKFNVHVTQGGYACQKQKK